MGRPTSPDDLTSGEQPIVFVIDDDESNLFQSVVLRVEVFGSAPELLRSTLPDVAGCLVRDARPLAANTEAGSRPLWRISTAPSHVAWIERLGLSS
jgi:hypothetical protein